jgi:hypothetical protein
VRVGVCDYPSRYAFPPHGYGGIAVAAWDAIGYVFSVLLN